MADLKIDRIYDAEPARLFALITEPQNMVRWWGYATMRVTDHNLDFTKPGPWHSEMTADDGTRRKVSGQVVEVDPPNHIRFTWGWHDDDGLRGHESDVTIRIRPVDPGKAQLLLHHQGFASDDMRDAHGKGWGGLLDNLDAGVRAERKD